MRLGRSLHLGIRVIQSTDDQVKDASIGMFWGTL